MVLAAALSSVRRSGITPRHCTAGPPPPVLWGAARASALCRPQAASASGSVHMSRARDRHPGGVFLRACCTRLVHALLAAHDVWQRHRGAASSKRQQALCGRAGRGTAAGWAACRSAAGAYRGEQPLHAGVDHQPRCVHVYGRPKAPPARGVPPSRAPGTAGRPCRAARWAPDSSTGAGLSGLTCRVQPAAWLTARARSAARRLGSQP